MYYYIYANFDNYNDTSKVKENNQISTAGFKNVTLNKY